MKGMLILVLLLFMVGCDTRKQEHEEIESWIRQTHGESAQFYLIPSQGSHMMEYQYIVKDSQGRVWYYINNNLMFQRHELAIP